MAKIAADLRPSADGSAVHTGPQSGRDDIPALTPAEAGTRFSDPERMQRWVDLRYCSKCATGAQGCMLQWPSRYYNRERWDSNVSPLTLQSHALTTRPRRAGWEISNSSIQGPDLQKSYDDLMMLRSTYDGRLIYKTSHDKNARLFSGTIHLQKRKIVWAGVRKLTCDRYS